MSNRYQEDPDVPSTSSSSSSSSTSWQNIQMSQSPYRDTATESGQSSSSGSKNKSKVTSRPSLYPTGQRTSSGSSIPTASGASAVAQNEISASSSSNSSNSATTTQGKSSRARVSMACVHCRQRKIRCDGAQPYCSTCFRLGRACVYEGISEIENILARERKKRSKEAKQARLTSLAGLGIPIPQSAHMSSREHGRVQSYPSTTGAPGGSRTASGSQQPHGLTSTGVIRDSRLARQERLRPYAASHASQQQHPSVSSYAHDVSSLYGQQSQHSSAGANLSDLSLRTHDLPTGRRRGVTMDSYPSVSPQLRYEEDYDGNPPSGEGPSLAVTSLSQPTTPEATYSMHVSMLSRDLSHQSQSPAEVIGEGPSMTSTVGQLEYALPMGVPSTVYIPENHPSALVTTYDYTLPSTAFTSAIPSLRSSVADSTLDNSFSSAAGPDMAASSSSMTPRMAASQAELEQQLAMRRRSSFDVGHFWRRTSVADAAVANFFDRVVQARGPRKVDDGSEQPLVSSPHRSHAYPMSVGERQSYGVSPSYQHSSLAGPRVSLPTQVEADEDLQEIEPPLYPTYGNLQQVMQDASHLDTPYTALTSDPTPLTFQHPFGVAQTDASSRNMTAPIGRFDRAGDDYYGQELSSGLPSPAAYPPSMYQTHPPPSAMVPTLSSSSSSSQPQRGERQQQEQPQQRQQYHEQQVDTGPMGIVGTSFSSGGRSFQRAAPPQQLNFGDLPSFGSPRQNMGLSYTNESSSTYGSAQSTLSPQHRMVSSSGSTGGPYGSSSGGGGAGNNPNNPGSVTYFTNPSSQGNMPPLLPTPMSELSSHMLAMAPPSTNLALSPTMPASPRVGSGHSEGDGGEGQYDSTAQHWPPHDDQGGHY